MNSLQKDKKIQGLFSGADNKVDCRPTWNQLSCLEKTGLILLKVLNNVGASFTARLYKVSGLFQDSSNVILSM